MKPSTVEDPKPGLWRLRHAWREMLEWRLIRVSLGVLGASVLILSVVGPVGIGDALNPLQRIAFAALCCVFCWPLCHVLSAAILYVARSRPPVQILLACTAGELFMAVPCTAVVFAFYGLFQSYDGTHYSLVEIYLTSAVLIVACRSVVHYVACQLVAVRHADQSAEPGLAAGRDEAGLPRTDAVAEAPDELRMKFFERLPDMVGRDIVYLTVSGHYINVVTTAGSCLVLMRLGDAVASLGDQGLQVHRSYWVARRHIVGVQRCDGRMTLRLTGAHEVPVSRTYLVAANAALAASGGDLRSR